MPNYLDAKRQIESFANLPPGWRFGEGRPSSKIGIRIMTALLIQAKMLGFSVFEAFPGTEGEIQLAIYDHLNFYAITRELDGEFTISFEREREEVFSQEHARYHDVIARLEEFAFELCNTPESSTPGRSPKSTAGLATLPLRTHLTAQGSLALKSNARLQEADQSAGTSPFTMGNLLRAIRSSTGSSQTALC